MTAMLVPVTSHDWKVMFHLIWSLWPNECDGAIHNTIGIPRICQDIVFAYLHCWDMSKYMDMSSYCVDTSRHCLGMQTHLDMCKYIDTCVDTCTHCVHTSRHFLDTFMIASENGLKKKKKYIFYVMILKASCCMNLEHVFIPRWWHFNVNSSLIGWAKKSVTRVWVICYHMWCVYEIGVRIPFPNNAGISQIICICMLLITTFFLHSYTFTVHYIPYYC